MVTQLKNFIIKKLWGECDVELKFVNNRLILIGENGSGKTTILRIIYETLACDWYMLKNEEFECVKVLFNNHQPIVIYKNDLKEISKLRIESDSELINGLPFYIRKNIKDYYCDCSYNITYEDVKKICNKYSYYDNELNNKINREFSKYETGELAKKKKEIIGALGCKVLYLPTYRRAENKDIRDFGKRKDDERYISKFNLDSYNTFEEQSLEVVNNSMQDVKRDIDNAIRQIRNEADLSASRLNYQCFKGIINKADEKVKYNACIMSKDEIEKVFNGINERVLSINESKQIKKQLVKMTNDNPSHGSYDKIVYFYYSMLHERYLQLKNKELIIQSFFSLCNSYLVNKKFVYNEKDYSYSIKMIKEKDREIQLENLSSGEKQVISVFSYLYLSPLSNSIVIIDEPELSLSVPWQRKFLLDISNGSKCNGIISATHSPFIFDNGLSKYAHAIEEFIK